MSVKEKLLDLSKVHEELEPHINEILEEVSDDELDYLKYDSRVDT